MALSLIYLASPYTDPKLSVRRLRFRQVRRVAATLMEKGLFVFCPVVHGHCIDEVAEREIPYEYWLTTTADFLARSDKLYVAMLKGWELSRGIQQEIDLAKRMSLPIFYLEPTSFRVILDPAELNKRGK